MADTHIIETERKRETNAEPQGGVEVYDTEQTSSIHGNELKTSNDLRDTHLSNNNLTNTLRTSDANPTDWRNESSTDLGSTTGTATGQGTNWGTILLVIAAILVIILLGSWLF